MFESVVLVLLVYVVTEIINKSQRVVYEGYYGILTRNGVVQRDSTGNAIELGPGKHYIRFWSDSVNTYPIKETDYTIIHTCTIQIDNKKFEWNTAIEFISYPGCRVYCEHRGLKTHNVFSQVILELRSRITPQEKGFDVREFLCEFNEAAMLSANEILSSERLKITGVRLTGYSISITKSSTDLVAEGGARLQIRER